MTSSLALLLAAATASGVTAAALTRSVVPPRRRLAERIRPYTIASDTAFGVRTDPRAAALAAGGGPGRRWLRAALAPVGARLGRLDATGEGRLLLRIRQAGLLVDVPEDAKVLEYRSRQLGSALLAAVAAAVGTASLGMGAAAVLLVTALAFLAGSSRWRARLDRGVAERRARMRIELYTVCQLLALHVRVGGGVVQAVQRVVDRGRGEVVSELREALIAHSSGARAADAFARIAAVTPEPAAARAYQLLASGAEHGADLATALLALAESVRDVRRDDLKRRATRRRAAMLVPIIAILGPVMLLFIAAPLPSLVFAP